MEQSIIKSCTVKIPVKDIKSSILFFQKIGFYISESTATNYSVSTVIKFSDNSDLAICLTQELVSGSRKELISFDLAPIDVDELSYEDVVDRYIEKGIVFENVLPSEINSVRALSMVFRDPDGNVWSLSDQES